MGACRDVVRVGLEVSRHATPYPAVTSRRPSPVSTREECGFSVGRVSPDGTNVRFIARGSFAEFPPWFTSISKLVALHQPVQVFTVQGTLLEMPAKNVVGADGPVVQMGPD